MSSSSSRLPIPSIPLKYVVEECSAQSGNYSASNIIYDRPQEIGSRWNGLRFTNQWLLLRLESPSVIRSIMFGKYHKVHPCNMKEFKVYVGATKDNLVEVVHASLKHDTTPETHAVKYLSMSDKNFVHRYVKIVPLSTHVQGYNTSIWHVALTGFADSAYLRKLMKEYDEQRETNVLRHILKHLRQRRLLTPYSDILQRSGLVVEHPLVSELYDIIVMHGDWTRAEKMLQSLSESSLFDAYLRSCQPRASWRRLTGTNADGDIPSPRAGHAMCMDHYNGLIYLFGGWDGEKSLDDFWEYDIKGDRWRILSYHTTPERNAPGARSCHKMLFDHKTGSIYVLGRLNDGDALKPSADTARRHGATAEPEDEALCSEFYRYHTRGGDRGKWDFLAFDTASAGGPHLIFDHQMVMDSEHQIIYVFGGRIVDGDWDTVKYSGLYSYNIRLSKWKHLQPVSSGASNGHPAIPYRFGHSMVLDHLTHTLYIFAGQRDDQFQADMFAYDINTNTATEIFSNYTASGGPDASFTQRAVIDPCTKEIYVSCGLTRSQEAGSATSIQAGCPHWVYQYHNRPGKWGQIFPTNVDPSNAPAPEPVSRYAHQAVYDPTTKTMYIHGGNAGISGALERDGEGSAEEESEGKENRLDDFWAMKLSRPDPEEVIRRANFLVRQQQFREMCQQGPAVEALNFLQTEVSSVVNHHDQRETEVFRALLANLLGVDPTEGGGPRTPEEFWTNEFREQTITAAQLRETVDPKEYAVIDGKGEEKTLSGERFKQRTELFECLMEFVSEEAKQPNGGLLEMFDREILQNL